MYLQESNYNVGAEHDLETFSQAISSKDSKWYEEMKAEMDSMASNRVWDLVELLISVKSIGCKWVFKTKTQWVTLSNIRQDSLSKGLLKGKESTTWRLFLLYQGKIHFELS